LALDAKFKREKVMVTCPALKNEELNFLLKNKILINADSFSQIEQKRKSFHPKRPRQIRKNNKKFFKRNKNKRSQN
jgi:diaminopimelate decarboxylase